MSFGRGARFGYAGAQGSGATPLASIDIDFTNNVTNIGGTGTSTSLISITRASSGTDLLPTSASSATFNIFVSGAPRITSGQGLLIEEVRTNSLTASTAPATQTCTLAIGTFVLWVNGAGSCAPTLGTALGTAAGSASQGASNTITITTSGTVVFTVTGSLAAFQCEKMSGTVANPSALIATGATAVTRAADIITITTPPSFGSGDAYTLYASFAPQSPTAFAANQSGAQTDSGANTNRMLIRRQGATGITLFPTAGGSAAFVTPLNTATPQYANTKVAVSLSAFTGALSGANIGKALQVSNPTLPTTPTAVHVGAGATATEFLNGYLRRLVLWPTMALTPAQMGKLTSMGGI